MLNKRYLIMFIFIFTITLFNFLSTSYCGDGDNNFLMIFADSPTDFIDSNTRDIVGGSDLDQDGKYEIIFTDYDNGGQVHVFEVIGDNLYEWVWSSPGTPSTDMFPVREVKTGDLDNNGRGEILISVSKNNAPPAESGIYVYEWDGVTDNGYVFVAVIPIDLGLTSGYTEDFIIEDIDGDNITEAVFLNNGTDIEDNCYIFSISGEFNGFWAQVNEAIFTRTAGDFNGGPYDVTVGDLDGDGHREVIVSVTDDKGGIFIAESPAPNTYVASKYIHLDTIGDGFSIEAMATADFDGDGADELFVALNSPRQLVVLTGGSDVNSITFENNVGILRTETVPVLGMAIGDQDHGPGSDGLDIYLSEFGPSDAGGFIMDLEFTGTDVFDPASYTEYIIFQDQENPEPAGLFQLDAPAVDLDGDGKHELLLSYTGDASNGIQIRLFEWEPLSLASISVSPETVNGIGGVDLTVDIIIDDNPEPIDAFGFSFSYCSDKLSFIEAQKGSLTQHFSFFEAIENPPGSITIGGFDTSPVPAHSNASIAEIVLHVDQCEDGETCPLIIQNLTDDILGFNIHNGTFLCKQGCLLGDVNMDEAITPGDALCAFQIYLNGGTPPPGSCDNECAMYASDVNCVPNGITPGDALYIFLGYLSAQTPPLDCDPSALSKGISGLELVVAAAKANPGEEITIAVEVNNPEALRAFGFDLGYPDELLSFVKVSPTNLTKDWQALDGKENVSGTITIGGFNAEAISSTKRGALLEVTFKVKDNANGIGDLLLCNLTDDAVYAEVNYGNFSTINNGIRRIGSDEIPKTFALEQNYPNPFNNQTEIVYQLAEAVYVNLVIYNTLGHKIRTLVFENQDAGIYTVNWDGKDEQGNEISSGVYIYRLETSKFNDVKKMMLVK